MKMYPLDLITSTSKLKKLIAEHPDLPIVVLAGTDATDGEQCMYCSDIRFTVDEILDCKVPYMDNVETDRDNFNQKIEVWLWDDMYANGKKILCESAFEAALKNLKAEYEPYWKKVICIYADN